MPHQWWHDKLGHDGMAVFSRKQHSRDQIDWDYANKSSSGLQDNIPFTQRDRETMMPTVRARWWLCSEEDDDVLAYPPVRSEKQREHAHKNLE
jgi:hypothetical protein